MNGAQSAYVEVSRGWVRLRLLHASNSRRSQLQMSYRRALHVISGDQCFVPAPLSLQHVYRRPGTRIEVQDDVTTSH